MEQERLAILEHPVVRSISDVDRSKGGRPGFRVSLWCQTARQNGHGECDCGGLRQGVPVCVSTTRTTLLASGKGAEFQHACYRCQHACYCPNMRFCKNHMSTCVAEFYMMLQNSNMHVAKFQHGVSNIRTWRFKTPNMHVTDMNINVTDTSMHVTDANMGKSQFI